MKLTPEQFEAVEREARGESGKTWPRTIIDIFDTASAWRAELASARERETAWLIERRDRSAIEYLTGDSIGIFPDWTIDSLLAIRFNRREDAERIAGIFDDLDVCICEHEWVKP